MKGFAQRWSGREDLRIWLRDASGIHPYRSREVEVTQNNSHLETHAFQNEALRLEKTSYLQCKLGDVVVAPLNVAPSAKIECSSVTFTG